MGTLEKTFSFVGELDASKSMMNRALILQSFANEQKIEIKGSSPAEDVVLMEQGLRNLMSGSKQPIDCGHAGTVLRFLALRASRMPGVHRLTGSERLFSRPQSELSAILGQLGVQSQLTKNELRIESSGWRLIVDGVHVNTTRSSQFASGVLLSAWNLPFALQMTLPSKISSEGYWKMTLEMVRRAGMNLRSTGSEVYIPANSQIRVSEIQCEPDLSSAFAVAALAVVSGQAEIHKFPDRSLQPDSVFVSILKKMGVDIHLQHQILFVKQAESLQGIECDIQNSPDLFPVLSVLCALARSESRITGTQNLQFKESSRLEKSKELLTIMGAQMDLIDEAVVIRPVPLEKREGLLRLKLKGLPHTVYHVDQDHRMAMAAEIARKAGAEIKVDDRTVVRKSFPRYFELSGGMS